MYHKESFLSSGGIKKLDYCLRWSPKFGQVAKWEFCS
jgi:hypothetical protein